MSTPSFDPDDPRLTAYALGEADEHERRAVEQWLAESAAARHEIAQTRALALALATEYARENERYLAAHPDGALPADLVAFPPARRRRWPVTKALILKAAAVLALTASLVYVGVRSHRPMTDAAASAPPVAPPAASPPVPASAELFAKDAQIAGTSNEDHDRLEPASAAAVVPGTGPSLALNTDQQQASSDQSAMAPAPAAPAVRRQALAALPDAAGVAAKSAKPLAPDEQIARSAVRIRCADGRFLGGVIVSPDGLILAATTLPDSVVRQPCTVRLPDQSNVPAVPDRSPFGAGWYWLRVKAHGLSAVPLAKDPPADGATLTVPTVDQASGELTLSHVRPGGVDALEQRGEAPANQSAASTSEPGFAFDPAGELLVFVTTNSPPVGKVRALATRATKAAVVARPLTAAELAILRSTIESDQQQRGQAR